MKRYEKRIRQKLKNNLVHYAEKCLRIRKKTGGVDAFVLNKAQHHIHACLEKQKQETGRVRALILKGRQQGCSTYVAARFYWLVTHHYGAHAFVMTHVEEAAKNIYKIVRRFHEHCPDIVKAQSATENAREMLFDTLDSAYRIGSARAQGVGRSETLQFFHGSEVAYWAHAEAHMAGILQAVPDLGGTEVILESTSDGATGLFYKMCLDAQSEQSPYQIIFVPWFWQDEYRLNTDDKMSLSAEEQDYKDRHDLSDGQILWRRMRIRELGGIWAFRREYPASIEEAFHADIVGALWTRSLLDENRIAKQMLPPLLRIVVAIDPAASHHAGSDETGIIVAGLGEDGHGYVLEDISGKYTPSVWAQKAIAAFHRYDADRIVAEVNQGGDMVEHTLRTHEPNIPYKSVRASRGKYARAEPIAALDEQGRIHHVGILGVLEDQMCAFLPQASQGKSEEGEKMTYPLIQISEPAVEPVSLTEAKQHLRLETTADDTFITSIIKTARKICEQFTGQCFIHQGFALFLDQFPHDGTVTLLKEPIASLDAVKVYDADDVAAVQVLDNYFLDPVKKQVLLKNSVFTPTPGRTVNGVEVDYTVGYGADASDVPDDIKQAILRVVTDVYENRGDTQKAAGDILSRSGALDILQPYRRMGIK